MSLFAKIQALATTRTVVAILLSYIAYVLIRSGIQKDVPLKLVLAGPLIVVAVGLALRTRWGQYAAIGALMVILLFSAIQLDLHNITLWKIIKLLCMGWVAWDLWKDPDSLWLGGNQVRISDAEQKEVSNSVPSLVLLRSRPRYLEPAWIASLLSDAWNLNITADKDKEDADGFVAGNTAPFHIFLTRPKLALFILHSMEDSYFDSPQDLAKKVPNRRFAEVITGHQAWLSLDFIPNSNETISEQEAYQWIGKGAAALADEDTQALMAPQHQYFNLWSASLEEQLTGADPLRVFSQEVKAPVVGVPDGDTLEQAIAEARQRWPEFVAALQARKDSSAPFIVKAPFASESGDIEHMWIEVSGVEPEYVHGHLLNEPFHNPKLSKGSQVEVPVKDISDWLYADAAGNAQGNFTQRAVQAAAKV